MQKRIIGIKAFKECISVGEERKQDNKGEILIFFGKRDRVHE